MSSETDKTEDESSSSSKTIQCRKCQKQFSPSKYKRRICYACINKKRDSDIGRYMARKLSDWLRRQGHSSPYPGVKFIRKVIEHHNAKATISGVSDLKKLSVIIIDPNGDWNDLGNTALVTTGESYALTRCQNPEIRKKILCIK